MRKILLLAMSILMLTVQVLAQSRTITGKVTDDKGVPVQNASVTIKGTSTGTTTNTDGDFSLNVPASARTLVISAIGQATQEVSIGSESTITVQLKAAESNLQEVVVVGYGSVKKSSLVGSVATVGGKEVTGIPIASIDQILQGKAPGVQITAQNGRPGANAYVRIRGTGSINASSDPLYVIDGVPTTADILNAINPNDIENISVLKDASASAIYGSRASNGVILITTKRGKAGKPQLTYRFNYAVKSKTADNYDMMNTRQKTQWEYNIGKDAGAFTGASNRGNPYAQAAMARLVTAGSLPAGSINLYNLTQQQLDLVIDDMIKTNGDNNWQDILLRDAPVKTHEISLSGGAEKLRYYMSLQRYDEDGIGLRSKFNRTQGRINLEYQATPWIKVGQNLTVAYTQNSLLRDRYNAQSPFYAMYAYNPYEPPYLAGTSNYNLTGFFAGFPILEAINSNPEDTWTVLGVANMFAELSLIKNVTLKTNLGLTYNVFERESFIRPGSYLDQVVGDPTAPGSKIDNGSRAFNYVWSNTATYQNTFADDHNVRVLIGTEYTSDKFKSYTLGSKGFASPNTSTQNSGASNTSYGTARTDWTLASLFATADYDFSGRYFVNASIRRDGSSRFSDDNKYGTFWSAGIGWNIAQENFFSKVDFINVLKLRASIGTAGNFNIGDYRFQELYGVSSYADLLGTFPNQVANDSLTWEKGESFNIGLEFEAFKGRLRGSVDYYNKKTKSLLLNVPYSQTNGFGTRLENIGEMENKGIEAIAAYDVVSNKNFTLTVRASATFNRNRITELYNNTDIPVTTARLSVGKPFYNYYLVRWGGVDPQTGAPQYLDKDGKITTTYSGDNAVFLDKKAPDPRYYGSFGLDVSYKNFSLTTDFYYSGGNYIYNYQERDRLNIFQNRGYNMDARSFDYWKTAG
ncbi:MAG: SusC/RagA family TonB-linked outer membrane protein, partial [Niastella sp.]|nr:SusC/RagA family TonB-linked outer membrane protein [Niastella sp.]